MATTLYFTNTTPDWSRGQGDANLAGTTTNWTPLALSTSRGAAVQSKTATSVTGATNGLEAGGNFEWISDPLDADVTISGSITANLWGIEAAMTANAGLGVIIQRLDSQGAIASTIMQNGQVGIEMDTSSTVRNEAASPTSTNMLKGDRLRVRVYFDDAVTVTMASGSVLTFRYAHTAAAADGDSYITFTENFGFLTDGSALITQDVFDDSGFGLYGGTGTNEKNAQGFNLAADSTLTSATCYFGKNSAPADNLVCDVVSTLDGTSLATASVAGSSVLSGGGYVTFTFSTPAVLTAGDYFLQLSRSGARDTTNFYQWRFNSTSVYAGGTRWDRASGSWSATSAQDFRFIIYGTVGTPTTLYLTDTASAVDPNGASYDAKEAWTARGGGVQSGTTSDVAGPTAPLLATVSAGGNFVEWFTKQLTAFTLDGLVACNIRAREVNAASNATVRCEVALTASDGTSPVVWGAANDSVELGTSEVAMTFNIAGDATAVTDGQRMRIRIYFDDGPGLAMGASSDMTFYWAGTSAAASGDTYITLPQTVTEFAGGGAVDNILFTAGGRGMTEAIYPTATG